MIKEVKLCDVCSQNIGDLCCTICNQDLCFTHAAGKQRIIVGSKIFGEMVFCDKCKKVLTKVRKSTAQKKNQDDFYDKEFRNKIFSGVENYLKNKILSENL